jgi:hypothetical protein
MCEILFLVQFPRDTRVHDYGNVVSSRHRKMEKNAVEPEKVPYNRRESEQKRQRRRRRTKDDDDEDDD